MNIQASRIAQMCLTVREEENIAGHFIRITNELTRLYGAFPSYITTLHLQC